MELDFTRLDGLAQREPVQGTTVAPELGLDQTPGRGRLQIEADQHGEAAARSLEICREYQANTRRSEAAQTYILNALQSGENPYRLLVTACECIGILTSNKSFSETVRADIEAIYGVALQQPEALEMELEGIQERLAMLTRPELDAESEDTRLRIRAAIKVHQRRAEDIERIMQWHHWTRHLSSAPVEVLQD